MLPWAITKLIKGDGGTISSLFSASCHQWKIKSLWGNHNLCHICRGCWNVTQSFDRLKSWKIDSSFSSVKQLQLLQTPFPEKHCENPEAEPYVGRDGAGKAFSLKLPSSHLNGNILYCEARNASLVQVKSGDGLSCRLARKPTHGTKQLYVVACKYGQHKMIIWQFSHIVQAVLVMAKWIAADCMTFAWPAVDSGSICPATHANMKGKCSQDVSNVHHACVASHQNQSDESL